MLLYFTGNDNGLGKEGAHFIGAKLLNIIFQIKCSSAAVVEAVKNRDWSVQEISAYGQMTPQYWRIFYIIYIFSYAFNAVFS